MEVADGPVWGRGNGEYGYSEISEGVENGPCLSPYDSPEHSGGELVQI